MAWIAVLLVVAGLGLKGQPLDRMSRQQYIEKYADLAMKEMKRTGIPASIKLAQGCLESDNGNSRLARRGNNHFGIKCHDWTGGKIYHDDDRRNECFRKYGSAYESYIDHSLFLTTKGRYSSLFDLSPDDYKRWARGLKKAGYATSRSYAQTLIRIIEENELDRYDAMVLDGEYRESEAGPGGETPRNASGYETARTVKLNNRIEYIITRSGDTPHSIREEFDLYPNEFYRYNDLERGVDLDSGMIIYLQPKRRKAARGNDTHQVEPGETLRDISQEYGVKIRHLRRLNRLEKDEGVQPGMKLNLRKKKSGKPVPVREREEDEPAMGFEFDG